MKIPNVLLHIPVLFLTHNIMVLVFVILFLITPGWALKNMQIALAMKNS